MKIGIDGRFFGPFGKGLGRYTQRLIQNLEKVDTKNEYTIFLRKENYDDYKPQVTNFTKELADVRWYTLKEQTEFLRQINQKKFDLMHFPHFNVPILYRRPYVVTIHDLIILKFPTKRATTLGPVKYYVKQKAFQHNIKHVVKNAQKIITVSEYSKKDLVNYFDLKSEDISVTYQAAEIGNSDKAADIENVRSKYGISKPYILYVGNVYPHKNVSKLVKAFEKINNNLQLVIVCKEDYFLERLKKEIGNKTMQSTVFTGFVSDSELKALYKNTKAYVFPSLYEGFGLPALEAMGHGIPVISSDRTSMPEILGDAAEYFNPEDVENIANTILETLQDENKLSKMAQKSMEQAQRYSWEDCAKKTLEIYETAL